jgi:hypothetical protein
LNSSQIRTHDRGESTGQKRSNQDFMSTPKNRSMMPRRKFLQISTATMSAAGAAGLPSAAAERSGNGSELKGRANGDSQRAYNTEYSGAYLNRVAFPMGGLGGRHDLPGRDWRTVPRISAE